MVRAQLDAVRAADAARNACQYQPPYYTVPSRTAVGATPALKPKSR